MVGLKEKIKEQEKKIKDQEKRIAELEEENRMLKERVDTSNREPTQEKMES